MFQSLLQTIPELKHEFELRRVIFGLTSIICTDPQNLPAIVSQRLPDIMKQLAMLSLKMREQRLEVLKDNEENIAEEMEKKGKLDGGAGDDDEEGEEGKEDEEGGEDGEGEGENILAKLNKAKKEKDAAESEEEEEDDGEDSDYEFTGGDLAIYDSALDSVDELLFIKETLEHVNAANAAYMGNLMGAMSPEELAKFNENMSTAQALKDREEVVRKQCDEIFDKKKFDWETRESSYDP